MEASGASPVTSAKVSALGAALDQASISAGAEGASPPSAPSHCEEEEGDEFEDDDMDEEDEEEDEEEEEDDDALTSEEVDRLPVKLPAKSPKKRGRTDSMKKALPPPASQRYKQLSDGADAAVSSPEAGSSVAASGSGSGRLTYTATAATVPLNPQSKLMVKDRKGSGMGTPNVHLILDAVKQAPPAKEKSNPRRWSKHEVGDIVEHTRNLYRGSDNGDGCRRQDESLRLAVERSGERNWKAGRRCGLSGGVYPDLTVAVVHRRSRTRSRGATTRSASSDGPRFSSPDSSRYV